MNRARILFMILMFCSVMIVFYTFVQYWQRDQNENAAKVATTELADMEIENAELRLHRDSLRKVLAACCKDSIRTQK